jgi:ABC-type lipoprotein export system ATPase subunit
LAAYIFGVILVTFVFYNLGLHLRRLGGESGSVAHARIQGLAGGAEPLGAVTSNAEQGVVGTGSVALNVMPDLVDTKCAVPCTVVLRDVNLFVPSASASAPGSAPGGGTDDGTEAKCSWMPGSSKGEVQLLHNISTVFEAGSITALMGPSGAGKTTLLNLIASRVQISSPGTRVEGLVSCLVHAPPGGGPDESVDALAFSHMCAYVEQEPTLFPLMTVRETLNFSANLRLPDSMPSEQRAALVDSVVDLMQLRSVLDLVLINRRIGAAGGSHVAACPLGAEFFKLVCIAVELVANPCILLMDEPTSG